MISRQWLMICSMVVLTSISSAFCADVNVTQKINCSGKVVDDANKAVAGVKVTLYMIQPDTSGLEIGDVNTEEQITKDDGSFSFSAEKLTDRKYRFVMLVTQKDGFAISWDNWDMRKDKTTTLLLRKPYKLQGVIVDDANKPVDGAEVRISMLLIGDISHGSEAGRYLVSAEQLDILKTVTDANGIFVFNNIPTEAKAEFLIKKAGRATVNTFVFNPSNYNPGQYTIQSKDIKIVQPVAAKIEGRVVESSTEKPVGGVKLICMAEPRVGPSGVKPVVSKDDGTFTIEGLEAKTYTVQGVSSQKETAKWVVEPVKVTTTAGQTSSGIVIKAGKGGVLEIVVRDNEKKIIAGVHVAIRAKDSPGGQAGTTDANGVATIRLAPGEYTLQGAYKDGYSSLRNGEIVTVEDGKTARLEIELKGSPKISGIVTDPKGKPLAGASIRVFPEGQSQDIKSDANGKYEIAWNPEQWGGNGPSRYILFARHIERNLAAAVDINEDTKILNVKTSQGIVATGKVFDVNNKPLADAQVHVNIQISNWGAYIDQQGIKTSVQGVYECKALPDEQEYSVSAQADGYGQSNTEVQIDEAVNGRLDIEPLILKLATMSVSGVVVDSNDKPVANAEVGVSGQGQQYRRGTTDAKGKFTIDKLCEGQIHINANVQDGRSYSYGYTNAEAGDTDIELTISPQGQGRMSRAEKQPPSLKDKPLPDMNSIGIKFDPNEVKDKAILLCFVDLNQRPSRHCFNELAEKYKELTQKSVAFAAVQVGNTNLDLKQAFPLGQIAAAEKTCFAWGIKSLPWLILTDKQHTIKAEGFTLGELDEKLAQLN